MSDIGFKNSLALHCWSPYILCSNASFLAFGNSLAVPWLGLGAFTVWARVQSLVAVGKLRSRELRSSASKKKRLAFNVEDICAISSLTFLCIYVLIVDQVSSWVIAGLIFPWSSECPVPITPFPSATPPPPHSPLEWLWYSLFSGVPLL